MPVADSAVCLTNRLLKPAHLLVDPPTGDGGLTRPLGISIVGEDPRIGLQRIIGEPTLELARALLDEELWHLRGVIEVLDRQIIRQPALVVTTRLLALDRKGGQESPEGAILRDKGREFSEGLLAVSIDKMNLPQCSPGCAPVGIDAPGGQQSRYNPFGSRLLSRQSEDVFTGYLDTHALTGSCKQVFPRRCLITPRVLVNTGGINGKQGRVLHRFTHACNHP